MDSEILKPIAEFEPVSEPQATEWTTPPATTDFEYQAPAPSEWAIPRTTQLPLGESFYDSIEISVKGPAMETNIDADLSPLPEEESLPPLPSIGWFPSPKESSHGIQWPVFGLVSLEVTWPSPVSKVMQSLERRQPSLISSTDSPVRESGYGTASTSYATELGDYAYKVIFTWRVCAAALICNRIRSILAFGSSRRHDGPAGRCHIQERITSRRGGRRRLHLFRPEVQRASRRQLVGHPLFFVS